MGEDWEKELMKMLSNGTNLFKINKNGAHCGAETPLILFILNKFWVSE